MKLIEFINSHDVDYSNNCIEASDIPIIEAYVSVLFGAQLKEYILNYGFLGYKYIDLFGVIKKMMERSDMVAETQYLHNYSPKTKDLIAIEDQGDGDFYLVDSEDTVYRYLASRDELTKLDIKLFDYIVKRFEIADEWYKNKNK